MNFMELASSPNAGNGAIIFFGVVGLFFAGGLAVRYFRNRRK